MAYLSQFMPSGMAQSMNPYAAAGVPMGGLSPQGAAPNIAALAAMPHATNFATPGMPPPQPVMPDTPNAMGQISNTLTGGGQGQNSLLGMMLNQAKQSQQNGSTSALGSFGGGNAAAATAAPGAQFGAVNPGAPSLSQLGSQFGVNIPQNQNLPSGFLGGLGSMGSGASNWLSSLFSAGGAGGY